MKIKCVGFARGNTISGDFNSLFTISQFVQGTERESDKEYVSILAEKLREPVQNDLLYDWN